MGFAIASRSLRSAWPVLTSKVFSSPVRSTGILLGHRAFHQSASNFKLKPYILADIGEGITECRLVQWFVKPGDRVEQFDAICEVQSDKASVEITSRYDGVIKDLKYEVDDMAIVGEPILTVDVEEETPIATSTNEAQGSSLEAPPEETGQVVSLTPNEAQMFKVMTDSLKIPHFGYTNSVDVTELALVRGKLNKERTASAGEHHKDDSQLTPLAIILKAISETFIEHPRLNAHLDTDTAQGKPRLIVQKAHNFGIAVDTSRGLLVPVVRDVQRHSAQSLAAEVKRLISLAREGQLAPSDMQGATFTVSNIGSIGGAAVSPIIVPPMTAIVAIGRIEDVPGFSINEEGTEKVVRRQKVVLSWSGDHRIHDGAAVGRCAEAVKAKLEDLGELESMLL